MNRIRLQILVPAAAAILVFFGGSARAQAPPGFPDPLAVFGTGKVGSWTTELTLSNRLDQVMTADVKTSPGPIACLLPCDLTHEIPARGTIVLGPPPPDSVGVTYVTGIHMLGPGRISTEAFRSLMETVAAGWNAGDARKAADRFTEDALYLEPPDRQFYSGRAALYEFFGGAAKPEPPMRMSWHHLAFDEESQVGFGEYTFQMNRRYHGIVVVRIRGGKIASWREYQYESPLDWKEFIRKSEP